MGSGLQDVAFARTVGGVSAASAFERNMIDDMSRLGTLRRSADGGYVTAYRDEGADVCGRLGKVVGKQFRGRIDGPLAIVEFPSFALLLDGGIACESVPVPDEAFLDFSEVPDGTVVPDPESEMALHAVFSVLDRLVVGRPLPSNSLADRSQCQLRELRDEMAGDLPGLLAALGSKLPPGSGKV